MSKRNIFSPIPLIYMAMIFIASGCASPRALLFADREWHFSSHYGQIIDKDTTFRMTFGNVLIPDPLVIISSEDSLKNYPGMKRFISDILHTSRLDSAEILFYAPEMHTMFVKPKPAESPQRPASISSPLYDDNPYTIWIYENDMEQWERKDDEMYTYTYFDKKKRQFLIVDFYDYGDTPIAQITIFQNRTTTTNKMNLPLPTIRAAYFVRPDLRNPMTYIQPLANWVETRRDRAFANYKIGQEQKLRGK